MPSLSNMTIYDMMSVQDSIREFGTGASCMEDVAERTVRYFYDEFRESGGETSCALVRFYFTHPLAGLEPAQRAFASSFGEGGQLPDSTPCFTLLATAGDRLEWNDRTKSKGHKAIPLPSKQAVARLPMVSQLFAQMDVNISNVIRPDRRLVLDPDRRTYNVFYVEDAVNNPYVPAQQEFVIPFHIRSVIGFGSTLPTSVFAVIMFAKTKIEREKAELFRIIAVTVKLVVLPFAAKPVFRSEVREQSS